MFRRLLLPVIFLILAYGFWISPNVKEIAAGVAIFLFGMLFLEEGFRALSSGVLERLLKRTTDKLWKSIVFGVLSSSITQSSSLVSLVTISFLSAGLILLSSGIGIIFGANIGTTTGAWLIAGFGLKVDIAAYAMPMLAFGIVLVFQRSKTLKGMGYVLSGLGFLFLGIHYMKEGFEAFKETIDLAKFAVSGFPGLVLFVLIGMFATVVLQSSHATLVLIITALSASQITYENALALAIGANIGTTITAIIGAMTANYQGKRLAAAHLIFNVVTGALAIILLSPIVWVVDDIAFHVGIANDDYTLKLAIFHTVFNVMGVAVMVPMVPRLVSFLHQKIKKPHEKLAEPRFITNAAFEFPESLIEAVRQETLHLYDNAFEILAHGMHLTRTCIKSEIDLDHYIQNHTSQIDFDLDETYNSKVKNLYADLIEFISTAQNKLPLENSDRLLELRDASINIVTSIKEIKHLRKNISLYIQSDNADIRKEYNKLRYQIAKVLREINELENTTAENRDILALDEIKASTDKESILTTNNINMMIREKKITANMATSLMNDLRYAHDAVWHLTDMAKALFGAKDMASKEAEKLMALTKDDVDEISTQPK